MSIYRLLYILKLEKLIDLALIMRLKYRLFLMRESQSRLSKIKPYQKAAYDKLKKYFKKYYSLSEKHNYKKFISSMWKEHNSELEKTLLPFPKFSFLQDPIIMKSMFATGNESWLVSAIKDIQKIISFADIKYILQEEYIGEPLIVNRIYMTTHNNIEHLYHLANFIKETACDINQPKVVIEWGGGYGNMAKLFINLRDRVNVPTYIMIDTPLISCLQWLYLSVVFGERMVHYIENKDDLIQRNKINIVSLPFMNTIKSKPDLFISTWALSESSKFSQDFVINRTWLKAPHIFLGYRESDERLPNSDRIGRIAKENGAKIIPIDFLPGKHFYAFK